MEIGLVVRSIAGRDKCRHYVIVALDGDGVKIADGKLRKLEDPKLKNKIHLSVTRKKINLEEVSSNKALKKILESMNQSLKNQNTTMGGN